jgi:hypothetical protein
VVLGKACDRHEAWCVEGVVATHYENVSKLMISFEFNVLSVCICNCQ